MESPSLSWMGVSIRAPNEGSDYAEGNKVARGIVSIHAPNEGSDLPNISTSKFTICFNPRSQ